MRTSSASKTTSYEGSRRRLKLWLIFVILFMGWAAYTMVNQGYSKGDTYTRYLAAQGKLDEINAQKEQLDQRVNMLNDPEYIQELARKEYGMTLPGEKPIQVSGSN
ncbi:septum formation initiator family protein [Paenibacillus sp. GCM10012307]|uniref:Septum formation initiator family protein n=1 Tax=Paenibacillus roseus TaxID=2798579 RepID=A0A934J421_9BACL|nr:septum formation initiator family protein [Paenibacillus roseus]MBJ6361264.1 septum formation initiator family protein [Paenibacillus roseus]